MMLTPPGTELSCSSQRLIALATWKEHEILRRGAERAGLCKNSDKRVQPDSISKKK
jgi:hypothetical protein